MTVPGSTALVRELDDFWRESQSLWQQWQYEADLDTKMVTGQQDNWSGYYNVTIRTQRKLQFNKLLRIRNMLAGYQRKNRLQSIVEPADNDPDMGEVADQMTAALSWVMRQDQTYEKISEAFDGSLVCGLNLLEVWMDFREDPLNGKICTDRVPFSALLMSPYWEKMDLSDCDRIWTRKYLSKRQLLSLHPDIGNRDLNQLGDGKYTSRDGKFPYMPQNWYQQNIPLYAYDMYWTKDYRKHRKLMDRTTGEMVSWRGTKEQFQALKRYNPNVELFTMTVPTIKMQCLVNSQLVYEEKTPWGLDRLPFVPSVGYMFPEVQNFGYRFFGVVRNARDAQVELNHRRNKLLDVLDAQVQSGLMVKEDALVNPEDAFFQGPGKILFFKKSANLGTDVVPITAPPVAPGWMELIQTLDQEIMSIVGQPEEMFGENLSDKDMSGVLFQAKMGASLVGMQNLFDNLNTMQKELAKIHIELMQNNFEDSHLQKILGKPVSPLFHDREFAKYNIITEEAELTSTQRQLQFMQAINLQQMGLPIPPEYILEKSTLQGKKEVIEKIQEQQQQAQQMAQMAQMQELEKERVLTRSLEAKAQSDFAGAEERKARAIADIGLAKQHTAQAAHDRAKTALDNAKALHEIAMLPEQRIMNLADFIMSMQERQAAMESHEEEEAVETAERISSDVSREESKTKKQQ